MTTRWSACSACSGCACRKPVATDITDIRYEAGYELLHVLGKGAKPADIPLPIPVLRAVREAVDGRATGPILRTRTGRRMDRARRRPRTHPGCTCPPASPGRSARYSTRRAVPMGALQGSVRCQTERMWRPWPDEEAGVEPSTRVEVDGEVFDVVARRNRPGQYHFAWVSGPNPDYGFSSGTSDGRAMSSADIEASIRDFLAQVDPETGYIE